MLRIIFSRAALFPWIGIVLMSAGAAFPEGVIAGMILLVIGANVAFYSLRDFSRNFVWDHNARPMLNLCLSFDHRICDGLQVGRFLQSVRRRLESMAPEQSIY